MNTKYWLIVVFVLGAFIETGAGPTPYHAGGPVTAPGCTGGGCGVNVYDAGELRSLSTFLYGRFEVRMKAAPGSGWLSSFFTFNDAATGAGDGNWNEIDLAILGRYHDEVEFNTVTGGEKSHLGHRLVDFNPVTEFRTYAFEWTPTYVAWFIDGVEVYRDEGAHVAELTRPQKLMMNLWGHDGDNFLEWLGSPDIQSLPVYAYYDWVKIYGYDNGQFTLAWTDDFNTFDESRWQKATHHIDGKTYFKSSHVNFRDGYMVLALTPSGQPSGTAPSPLLAGYSIAPLQAMMVDANTETRIVIYNPGPGPCSISAVPTHASVPWLNLTLSPPNGSLPGGQSAILGVGVNWQQVPSAGGQTQIKVSIASGGQAARGTRIPVKVSKSGLFDRAPRAVSSSEAAVYGDVNGYYRETDSISTGDANGDGLDDVLVGSIAHGAFMIQGRSGGWTRPARLADSSIRFTQGPNNEFAGSGVLLADVDGDGIDDVIVGDKTGHPTFQPACGSIHIFFGRSTWPAVNPMSGADVTIFGDANYSSFGVELTSGDFNGDGFADLVATADNDFQAAYVIYGRPRASWPTTSPRVGAVANVATLTTTQIGRDHGWCSRLDTGDFDNDGYDDLVVGNNLTRRFLVYGSLVDWPQYFDLANASAIFEHQVVLGSGDWIASGGDVNGDGRDDLLLEAGGRSYLLMGPAQRWSGSIDVSTAAAAQSDFFIHGTLRGDINKDGTNDLVLIDSRFAGRAKAYFGRSTLPATLAWNNSDYDLVGFNQNPAGNFSRMTGSGDFNGDGYDDLIWFNGTEVYLPGSSGMLYLLMTPPTVSPYPEFIWAQGLGGDGGPGRVDMRITGAPFLRYDFQYCANLIDPQNWLSGVYAVGGGSTVSWSDTSSWDLRRAYRARITGSRFYSRNAAGCVRVPWKPSKYMLGSYDYDKARNMTNTAASMLGNQLPIGTVLYFWNPVAKVYTSENRTRSGWLPGTNKFTRGIAFWLYPPATPSPPNAKLMLAGLIPDGSTPHPMSKQIQGNRFLSYGYPVTRAFLDTALAATAPVGTSFYVYDWTNQGYKILNRTISGWGPAAGSLNIVSGEGNFISTPSLYDWNEPKPYVWP